MASTVIDSLVVLLGLDASNFKKGRETAEKETQETARKSKLAADDITKSLAEVGRTIAGLFLGFESATGFAKWLGSLNAGEAALGRTAANIGMSAHELNRWGNAVKLAGGEATDAQAAFSQITEDFQKMNATGEQSALLQFLRARSVQIRDQNGNLRDQGQIFEELADKTEQYGRQYQVTMFRQIGLSQGYINYLTQTKALREDQLRLAERNNKVDEDSVRKAQELQEYWRNIGTQIESVGQSILTTLTPAVKTTFAALTREIDDLKSIASAFQPVADVFKSADSRIDRILGKLPRLQIVLDFFKLVANPLSGSVGILHSLAEAARASGIIPASPGLPVPQVAPDRGIGYVPPAGTKAARFNNPGNILDRAGNERSYATLEEGRAALENDIRAKLRRGLRTVDAFITAYEGNDTKRNDIPAYIADVRRQLGKNDLSEADVGRLAYAISTHENGASRVQSGPTPGLVGATRPASAAAGAGNNSTTVTTGDIHVHAPSADPRAVAEQVPAAIQRKFAVTQADTGQS